MRPHTTAEAVAVVEVVEEAQAMFESTLGHPMVHAADEYYLLAGREFPPAARYGGFGMHEDGIGMARAFEMEFRGDVDDGIGVQSGFFDWVDGAPAQGYRAPRVESGGAHSTPVQLGVTRSGGSPAQKSAIGILSGPLGAAVLEPLVVGIGRPDVRVIEVANHYFGGNTGVTGLMVGEDVSRVLADAPQGHRYLLPDVCLSRGVFLDGVSPQDLPQPVEVVPTDGVSLRKALGESDHG